MMIILISIVVLALLVLAGVVAFFYSQLKRNRHSGKIKVEERLGTCSRCQQHRIIVKQGQELCAACWSSINTKQLA